MFGTNKNEVMLFGFRGFPGVQGGIETHVEHLSPRLVARGRDVTACVRSPYVPRQSVRAWRGVKLRRVWTVRNAFLEAALHSLLCACIAGFVRPAVVHVHGVGPALVTPLLRLFGLRVVFTHHGPDYDREKWGYAARLVLRIGEAMGVMFANQRIAVSQGIADSVHKRYGIFCKVIPNGVVVLDLPRSTDRVTALGLDPGHYVLIVGRLVPEKRQLDLLRAFVAVKPPGWKLAIVGQADHGNEYAERVMTEAARTDTVVMTGFRSGEDLQQLYAQAGLFVLPSSHEGLPIALLEALSFGVPVLVSDIPANREVVGSDDACLFRLGNITELGEKMLAHIRARRADPDRELARRANVRRFDWNVIAEQVDTLYDDANSPVLRLRRPTNGIAPK